VLVQVIDPQRGLYIVLPASGVAGPEAVGAFAPKGGLVPVFTGPAFGSITIAPGPTPAPPGTKPVDRQTLRVVTDQAFVVAAPPPAAGDVIFVRDRGYVNLGLRPTSGEVIIVQDVGVIIAFRPPASGDYLRVRDGTILTVTPPVEKVVPPGSTQAQVIVTDLAYTAIGIRPTSGASIRIADQSIVGTLTPQRLADAILVQDRSYLVASVPPSGLTTVTVTDQARVIPSVASVSPPSSSVVRVREVSQILFGLGYLLPDRVVVTDVGRWVSSLPLKPSGPESVVVVDQGIIAKAVIPIGLERVAIFDSGRFAGIPPTVLVARDTVTVTDQALTNIYTRNSWLTAASDPVARSDQGAAYDSQANLTYSIDGYNGSATIVNVTAYSRSSNAWTSKANDVYNRNNIGAAYDSSANLTYAIDGSSSSGAFYTAVTAFSNASDSWTTVASDVSAQRQALGSAYDSSANLTYAVDGYTVAGTMTNTVTAYSEPSNSWTTVASDTVARTGIPCAYDSHAKLTYAVDGENSGTTFINTVTAYSHSSNAWTTEASDLVSRDQLPGGAYDSFHNLTYVADGTTAFGGTVLSELTTYSSSSNTWTQATSDPTARYNLAAAYDSVAGLTYFMDGNNISSNVINTVEAFTGT